MQKFILFILIGLLVTYNNLKKSEKKIDEKSKAIPNNLASSIDYSFVIMGCNRISFKDTNSVINPSTANLNQLNRTFEEVAKLDPKPEFFFFLGDLVLGLVQDTIYLEKQLQSWIEVYENSPIYNSGIKLVAIPGNHEMLYYNNEYKEEKNSTIAKEISWQASERVWQRVMQEYIMNNNGPKAGDKDNLITDQSKMTYSFDFRNTHFVIMNTDTYSKASSTPANWIVDDIVNARNNKNTDHIFLLGHRPAYCHSEKSEDEGLGKYPEQKRMIWNAMEENHCDAMLSAHNHVYYKVQPTNKCWQVIAGNGGSELIKSLPESERFFGYTIIYVMKDGRVILKSMGRDEPESGYLGSTDNIQTTMRDSADISWK